MPRKNELPLSGIVLNSHQYCFLMALADLMRDEEWDQKKRDAIIRSARRCFPDDEAKQPK